MSPTTVGSSAYTQLTAGLSGPAPTGGAIVTLMSGNSTVLPVPQYITVLAGQTTASTFVHTGSVATSTSLTVTATYNNSDQFVTVTVLPVATNLTVNPATSITASSAHLSGTINPEGDAGNAYFYYGTSPTNLIYAGCGTGGYCAVTAGTKAESFNFTPTGLLSNTTYYYQIQFYDTSNNTWAYGTVLSFETEP